MNNKLEKLLKVNLWISKYIAFSIPFVIWIVTWSINLTSSGEKYVEPKTFLWEILSWNFIAWFVLLVYFIISLVFWGKFREAILTALTFSKERDERESFISGRASKATFYSTLSILILFFFLSGLHLHIYRKPKEEAVDGKRGSITIGYSFNFVNSAKKDLQVFDNSKNEKILVIDGIPFTQESLILFLILYHIASYHIFTRKRFEEV
jgi:hypothetical protein